MSDYVKKRAIRYKLKTQEIQDFEKLLIDDDSEWLPELLLQYFQLEDDYNLGNKKDFTIGFGCDYANGDEIYVDYLLEYEYGANGDYVSSRELTKEENDKYLPMFKERFPSLDIDELHYVDYCYYNAVDEPAVYDVQPIE